MKLQMAALDHHTAGLTRREPFSFSSQRCQEILEGLKTVPGLTGAVLLSTCNRTELYVTGEDSEMPLPRLLLCAQAGVDPADYEGAFLEGEGEDAAWHLMEVACGLRSMILCEDQIITQVRKAASLAREADTQSPVLETLFRTAATAAKKAKTQVTIQAVPRSSADRAVELLKEHFGTLTGRRAMVIGNGEMGRLCATRLVEAGCQVTVTLRSYHHGETVVPFGCETIAYDSRETLLSQVDLVISATLSPHYTLTREMVEPLAHRPAVLVDLAVPRDLDPALSELDGIRCFDMDQMTTPEEEAARNAGAIAQIRAIMEEQLAQFRQWLAIHQGSGAIARIKELTTRRLTAGLDLDTLEKEDLIPLVVEKTVDMVLFSAKESLSYELIRTIEQSLLERQSRQGAHV